jgi:hypothetical protein
VDHWVLQRRGPASHRRLKVQKEGLLQSCQI